MRLDLWNVVGLVSADYRKDLDESDPDDALDRLEATLSSLLNSEVQTEPCEFWRHTCYEAPSPILWRLMPSAPGSTRAEAGSLEPQLDARSGL